MIELNCGEGEVSRRRRLLLGAGVGGVSLLCTGPTSAAVFTRSLADHAMEPLADARTSDVYAYPMREGKSTVVAVTWREPVGDGWASTSEITLHSSPHRWTAILEKNPRVVEAPEFDNRSFIGDIAPGRTASADRLMGFFVEAPTALIAGGTPLSVWAERRLVDGTRRRVGSPLMATLIAEHSEIFQLYHALTPDADHDVLLEPLKGAITTKTQSGIDARTTRQLAERLANELLPDVLRYDPSRPCGFTFAARNGRFPADRCEAVVRSILTRSVTS